MGNSGGEPPLVLPQRPAPSVLHHERCLGPPAEPVQTRTVEERLRQVRDSGPGEDRYLLEIAVSAHSRSKENVPVPPLTGTVTCCGAILPV